VDDTPTPTPPTQEEEQRRREEEKRRWRRRLRRAAAAKYLNDVHGIPFTEKTLRNRNAAGLEPLPEYLGTIPFYQPARLDAFALTAFTPESPVAVTRRRNAGIADRTRKSRTLK
jgi:hypothetical protein